MNGVEIYNIKHAKVTPRWLEKKAAVSPSLGRKLSMVCSLQAVPHKCDVSTQYELLFMYTHYLVYCGFHLVMENNIPFHRFLINIHTSIYNI